MHNIKLLALDIDGTIAGKSNRVSQRLKQTLFSVRAKGIQIAIATGRMYRSALLYHEEVGSSLPLIAYQGAWIQEPSTKKVHRHLSVSKELAHQLLDYFEQPELRNVLSVHFYINDELYVRELTPDSKAYAKRCNIKPIVVGDLRSSLNTHQPTKILALCKDTNIINNLLQNLRQQYTKSELYLTTSVPIFLEATNPLVNKGAGVRYLAEELLGLQSNNVMAIGDNFNDLEMLQYAGISVAMGDAPPGVQAQANWVAPDVEQDGAAIAIEKFLL